MKNKNGYSLVRSGGSDPRSELLLIINNDTGRCAGQLYSGGVVESISGGGSAATITYLTPSGDRFTETVLLPSGSRMGRTSLGGSFADGDRCREIINARGSNRSKRISAPPPARDEEEGGVCFGLRGKYRYQEQPGGGIGLFGIVMLFLVVRAFVYEPLKVYVYEPFMRWLGM